MDFAKTIKLAREQKRVSARQFHKDADFAISYAHYAAIERGATVSIGVALAIIEALGLDRKKALYAWARDQMPDEVTKSFFETLDAVPDASPSLKTIPGDICTVNRMQAKLLARDPIYTEILTYLSFYSPSVVTAKTVSTSFACRERDIKSKLQELYDYGLINATDKGYRAMDWLVIPEAEEFKGLRSMNFKRALDKLYSALEDGTETDAKSALTRLFSSAQKEQIIAKMKMLNQWIMSFPEEREGTPLTVVMGVVKRKFGNA